MQNASCSLHRRAFLHDGCLFLAAAAWQANVVAVAEERPGESVRIGLITDLHSADKPPAGTRFYRETLDKLAVAASQFALDQPAFLVELGDLIDAADSIDVEIAALKRINREFSAIAKDRRYVLGNHCVDLLTKAEFLGGVEQEKSYDSFDHGGYHFIILDACFRSDGAPYGRKNSKWNDANIPAAELEWLEADLKGTDRKTVVFVHQRLDVANDHGIKNAPSVRRLFEASGKVLAVFQGHSHKNDYKDIAGIHYCTLRAMVEGSGVENNGYSLLTLRPDGAMVLKGFVGQKSYEWGKG